MAAVHYVVAMMVLVCDATVSTPEPPRQARGLVLVSYGPQVAVPLVQDFPKWWRALGEVPNEVLSSSLDYMLGKISK